MARIVVVGAGISGLSLSHRLQELLPHAEVVVLEERSRAGGTIATIHRDGFLIEAGPNGFPDNNPSTLNLARSVGVEESLISASESAARNRFLFLRGKLKLLPSSLLSFVQTDLLSWIAKTRLLLERYRPRTVTDRDESIDDFARRRVGDEIARTFVDAFVTGILAGDPKLLSVRAAFPRLYNWERESGSILRGLAASRKARQTTTTGRGGKLWSFDRGLATLTDATAASLRRAPILGVPVRRIRRNERSWRVEAEGNDVWEADAVVLTCPAYRQAEMLADLDASLSEQLASIAYNRVVVVAMGFRRADVSHALDGFGYLSPQRERRDVLGVQWCSSIYRGRAPEGFVLLRAICGGWHRGSIVDWSDEQLIAAVRAELARSLQIRVAPVLVEIVRWPRAIPQYHLGHLDRLDAIASRLQSHQGLFLGGNSFRGVAMNDCVEQGGLVAQDVREFLENRGQP